MIKKFYYSSQFEKNFSKLEKNLRTEAIEELNSFAENPEQTHYRIHPLRKKFSGWFSMTISPDLLIIFKFTKADHSEVLIHNIGTHEIYLN